MTDVVAHAGSPTAAHGLVDAVVGVAIGVAAVAVYLLLLRYYGPGGHSA